THFHGVVGLVGVGLLVRHRHVPLALHFVGFVSLVHFNRAVALIHDQGFALLLNGGGPAVLDGDLLVVANLRGVILLGVDVKLLRVFLILETNFVEAPAAFGTIALDGALSLVVGQGV